MKCMLMLMRLSEGNMDVSLQDSLVICHGSDFLCKDLSKPVLCDRRGVLVVVL